MSGAIEDGIADKLKATAAVTAICGQRVFVRLAGDKSFPRVTVSKPGGQESVHCSSGATGLQMGPVNVACYGANYKSARDLATAVRVALDSVTGTFGATTVRMCLLQDEQDMSTLPQLDDEVGFPGFMLTFRCGWLNPLT